MVIYFRLYSHTSGRPCKGNATITVFFRPREEVWNATKGWERPFTNGMMVRNPNLGAPEYKPIAEIPVMDYYMYLKYDYRFVDYVSVFQTCGLCKWVFVSDLWTIKVFFQICGSGKYLLDLLTMCLSDLLTL